MKFLFVSITAFLGMVVLGGYWLLSQKNSETVSEEMPLPEEAGPGQIVTIPKEQLDPVSDFVPTEVFRGVDVAGEKIEFRQQDYQHYELDRDKLEYRGDLNTERGWQDDAEATVYILNWQRPTEEQVVFVRTTTEPKILIELDGNRQPVVPRVVLNLAE